MVTKRRRAFPFASASELSKAFAEMRAGRFAEDEQIDAVSKKSSAILQMNGSCAARSCRP
jgi:hypothetical protein